MCNFTKTTLQMRGFGELEIMSRQVVKSGVDKLIDIK